MITFAEVIESPDMFYKNESVQIKIGNNDEYQRGKLFLSPNNISIKLDSQENAFIIPWSTITVQAITQEPSRSVYFMIDVSINLFNREQQNPPQVDEPMNGNQNGNDENAEDSDEGNGSVDSESNITEFWLLPDNPEAVDEIYQHMTKYPENPPSVSFEIFFQIDFFLNFIQFLEWL